MELMDYLIDTNIVMVEKGKLVWISAEELRSKASEAEESWLIFNTNFKVNRSVDEIFYCNQKDNCTGRSKQWKLNPYG